VRLNVVICGLMAAILSPPALAADNVHLSVDASKPRCIPKCVDRTLGPLPDTMTVSPFSVNIYSYSMQ